jgi:hypothetical protein
MKIYLNLEFITRAKENRFRVQSLNATCLNIDTYNLFLWWTYYIVYINYTVSLSKEKSCSSAVMAVASKVMSVQDLPDRRC